MQKTRLALLICKFIALSLLLQNCGFYSDKKQSSIEADMSAKKNASRIISIKKYITAKKLLSLPIEMDAMNSVESLIDSTISINPIVGCIDTTEIYYAFLTLTIGDLVYPTIETFDKTGRLIQSEIIVTGNCIHPVIEPEKCYDSVIISNDLRIFGSSNLSGAVEKLNESSQEYEMFSYSRKQLIEGEIQSNGRILLNRSEYIEYD